MSLIIKELIMVREFFKELHLDDVVDVRTGKGDFNMMDLY